MRLSAFGVYRNLALANADELPVEMQRALAEIRRVASAHGALRVENLDEIQGQVAREVARMALTERALKEAFEADGALNDVDRFSEALVVDRVVRNTETPPRSRRPIPPEEIDQTWFAAHFAQHLIHRAWTTAPVNPAVPPIARVLLHGTPEMNKAMALVGEGSPETGRALGDVILSIQSWYGGPDSMERAVASLSESARAVFQGAKTLGSDPVGDPPEVAQALLDQLRRHRLYGVRVQASNDQQAELGRLPAMNAIASRLEARGLLGPDSFADIDLVIGTHLLPALEQLVDLLIRCAGLSSIACKGQGVSSSPITVAGLERGARRVDPGFGDSLLLPEEHRQDLVDHYLSRKEHAQRHGRKLLGLGGGYESARAMVRATQDDDSIENAYVVFTQSGLNALEEEPVRRFACEAFADAPLKKLIETTLLGEWIVAHEVEQIVDKGRPVSEMSATVIGFGGAVGPSVAEALRSEGFGRVIVVEKDGERAKAAHDAGFEVVLQEDEPGPATDYYFSCVGRPRVVDERMMRGMKDGAVIVNCASRGEVDQGFMIRALRRKMRGVRAYELKQDKLPDHRTIGLIFKPAGDDQSPKRIFVRKMGQPFFDGVRDKDRMLVDAYMAGLLASLSLAAARLREGTPSSEIRTLPPSIQLEILDAIEEAYRRKFPNVREAISKL